MELGQSSVLVVICSEKILQQQLQCVQLLCVHACVACVLQRNRILVVSLFRLVQFHCTRKKTSTEVDGQKHHTHTDMHTMKMRIQMHTCTICILLYCIISRFQNPHISTCQETPMTVLKCSYATSCQHCCHMST